MYRVLILEDNPLEAKGLELLIYEADNNIDVIHYNNEESAYNYALNNQVDLFIVEIKLKNGCGYNFAKRIRKLNEHKMTFVIFATYIHDIRSTAFEHIRCYDYFIKPIDNEAFKASLLEILDYEVVQRDPAMLIRENKASYHVYHRDIIWIDVDTKNKETLLNLINFNVIKLTSYKYPIKAVEKELGRNFIRIHKSNIVNRDFIEEVGPDWVRLKNGMFFKIGKTYAENVVKRWERR